MQSFALSFDLVANTWNTPNLPAIDSPRTLVLAFGAPEVIERPAVIAALATTYPRSLLVGCSSAGEIHGTTVRDHSLSVTVTRFDKTDLQLASLEVGSPGDSRAAGTQLAKRLAAKPGLRGVLVLSEGLNVNGSELIRGLNEVLDDSIVVTGGLSGDGANFKRTWVAVGAKVRSNIVAAVGFYGDHVTIGHGSKGGWDKFGPERIVTRSEGNVLFELDGKPALQLYKEYLGDKAKDLPASGLLFPLSLRASAKHDKFVVRTLLSVDHAANSLTFAGDIPRGHLAQLMKADFDRLIDGAGVAGAMTAETGMAPANADSLVVAISCVGRRLVLGARTEEEVEAVRDAVKSERARITGFYSYGEISPYATGHCDLHNQTMTLTVFSESPTPLPARVARGSRPALTTDGEDTTTGMTPMPADAVPGFAVVSVSYDHTTRAWSQRLPAIDSPRTLVLAFGAPELADDPTALGELAAAYPHSVVVGCSSAGEIHGTTVRDHSLAVSVTRFDKTDLQLASLEVGSAGDSRAAGTQLARRLAAKPGLRGVLVLSEGLNVNGSELIRGLNEVFDDSIVVTGGLSGDGANFKRTWVAVGAKVRSNVVAAVGFYGDHVTIGHGSKGGWDKFGPERVITRSEGNVLFELDGKPALQLYKEYLGDKAKDLPASGLLFPLSLRASAKDDKFVVRTLLSVDHAANSLTFAGDIPRGHLAQLMKADFDRLIDGAGVAGSMTAETGMPPANADSLVIAISCVGRRLVLGARVEEEVEAVRDAVKSNRARITGFYSYGEISPYATGHCDLHNQTMTLTVLSESPTPLVRPTHRRTPATQAAVIGRPVSGVRATIPPNPPRMTAKGSQTDGTPLAAPERRESQQMPAIPRRDSHQELPQSRQTPLPTELAAAAPRTTQSSPRLTGGMRPVVPSGPILRLPRQITTDAAVEISQEGALQLVRLHGRITESFKGDAIGRKLSGRVVFDLADVDRVTSFGVREWLSMLSAATGVSELYFARCSESVVNQLTMIRKFGGPARVASFFAPFLCSGCGNPVERLFDCEHDTGELAAFTPAAVVCPRCEAEAKFDDDPRSYFAFSSQHIGTALPADVRALHDLLIAHTVAPVTDEIEKTVDGDGTRIRVQGKLTAQIRWRKILDGIEGALAIDLGSIPTSEPAGLSNLEQALRALPAEVKPIEIEAAPLSLLERVLHGGNRRVRIVSAVLTGYCDACAVNRPATVRIDQYAADAAAGQPHGMLCKRCNGGLALTVDESFKKIVEIHQRPTRLPTTQAAPVPEPASITDVPVPSPRRGVSWVTASVMIVFAATSAVLGMMLYVDRKAPSASASPQAAPPPVSPPVVATPPTAHVAAPEPAPSATWQTNPDIPPPWVERPFAIEGDAVFVVGNGTAAATPELALEAARAHATFSLVEHVLAELAGTAVHDFVLKRVRPDAPDAQGAIAARFSRQHGMDTAFERADVSSRKTADGHAAFVRYRIPKAQYERLIAGYRETVKFRGLEVARFFPLLESALHTAGDLIVISIDKRGAAAASGIREGDVIRKIGSTPVATQEAFRTVSAATWAALEPRRKLVIEVEAAGAVRAVEMIKPAPVQ